MREQFNYKMGKYLWDENTVDDSFKSKKGGEEKWKIHEKILMKNLFP